MLTSELVSVRTLVKTEGDPSIEPAGRERPIGFVMSVAGEVEVLVGLKGHVDADKDAARVEREKKKVVKDIEVMQKKLASSSFLEKAPPDVVAQAKDQLGALLRTLERLEEALRLAKELN